MSALDVLSVQCERRGWRVALTGGETVGPTGHRRLQLATLEVHDGRKTLALVPLAGIDDVDHASVELARSLAKQGLIA